MLISGSDQDSGCSLHCNRKQPACVMRRPLVLRFSVELAGVSRQRGQSNLKRLIGVEKAPRARAVISCSACAAMSQKTSRCAEGAGGSLSLSNGKTAERPGTGAGGLFLHSTAQSDDSGRFNRRRTKAIPPRGSVGTQKPPRSLFLLPPRLCFPQDHAVRCCETDGRRKLRKTLSDCLQTRRRLP